MAKLTLNTIGSRYGSIDSLNDNFDAIEQALENTLSRDGTSPNGLEADLDMNSNSILNAATIHASSLVIGGQTLEPGSAVAAATVQVFEFTATAGQTSFSVSPLTPASSSVLVEVNGLSLPTSSLVTSGSTLSFPALTLGDEVVVKVFTREIGAYPAVTNNEVATNAAIVSSKLAFTQAGTGAQVRTVESKLRESVSVKDFGAVGDGVADDTAAIQAAINAALAGGFKKLVFPQGNYLVSSTITVPSYYNASLAAQLWGSVGQDFILDFTHSTITTSISSGSTLFDILVGDYPQSRYFLDITGGTFFPTNSNIDIFKINGGSMWMCRFNGQSVPAGRDVNSLVLLYNTSATYQPGLVSIRDAVVSGESVFTFDGTVGGILFGDNFTIDNIYHFGTSASSGTIRFIGATGLTASRISKIVHVGVGKIVSGGATGGYFSYSSLTDLYSESTTTGIWLVDCALVRCDVSMGRLYILDHSTQTTGWYAGLATNSKISELHVNSGTAGGGVFYDTAAYAYYPILAFGTASIGNQISGYTQNEYKNVVNGRSGAVIQVDTVSPRQVLTSFNYNAATLSTTGFTQCGSTIPQVQYLGKNFVLDIELSGVAFGASAKTLAVEVRIGSTPITVALGPDIAITAGQWKAQGRLLFQYVSGTTYNVILSYGQSWSSSTVGSNKVGTADISTVSVLSTDAISFGLNAKTLSSSGVVIGDGSIELITRNGIYDSLV